MKDKRWRPLPHTSSWRKISVGMWDGPGNPAIFGYETLDVTDTLEYLEAVSQASGTRVTLTSLFVRCVARTLEMYPELNVIIINGKVLQRSEVNIFCQVAIPAEAVNEADLSGVKLQQVHTMDLVQIAQRLKYRAAKVRRGEDEDIERQKSLIDRVPPVMLKSVVKLFDFLTFNVPVELDALGIHSDPFGTCMISNIGSLDLKLGFAPLIAGARCPLLILPGMVYEDARVHDGEIKIRKVIDTTLTCDHRCYDGYQLSLIAKAIRAFIQHPASHFPPPEHFEKYNQPDAS